MFNKLAIYQRRQGIMRKTKKADNKNLEHKLTKYLCGLCFQDDSARMRRKT